MATDNQAEEFWNEKSETYGGSIRYKSFARLLGMEGSDERDLSGLIYLIGDLLIFEDFEKQGGLLGLLMRKPKEKYDKTLIEISVGDIRSVKRVSQKGALRRLQGDTAPLQPISRLASAVSVVVHEIILDNGTHLYFEIMDKTSLEDVLAY